MISGFQEFQKAGQDGLNKTMESFGVCSKGMQAIAVEAADYSKKSFEAGAAHSAVFHYKAPMLVVFNRPGV